MVVKNWWADSPREIITNFMATHENKVPEKAWGIIIPTGGFGQEVRLRKLLNFLEYLLPDPKKDMVRVLVTGYGLEQENIIFGVRSILARLGVKTDGLNKRVLSAHCQTTPGNAKESYKLMKEQGWGDNVFSDRPWMLFALGRHQLPRRKMCFESVGFRNMDLVCFDDAPGNLSKVDYEARKYVENSRSLNV